MLAISSPESELRAISAPTTPASSTKVAAMVASRCGLNLRMALTADRSVIRSLLVLCHRALSMSRSTSLCGSGVTGVDSKSLAASNSWMRARSSGSAWMRATSSRVASPSM